MKSTIAIAVSGGVDSLVAAYLLKREGHQVIGLHFLTGFESHSNAEKSSNELMADAHNRLIPLSKQLDIPIKVVDLRAEFKTHVIDYFVATYLTGQTPNPCLVCNPTIKFDALARHASDLGASGLATGHYARLQKIDGNWSLVKGVDPIKDQSYFLARLTQKQLAFARFPLGDMHKSQIITLAKERGLTPVTKGESQDICFIQNGSYGDFLTARPEFKMLPGPIEDTKGNVVGSHQGLHLFTIGQRRGINCPAKEPYYVIRLEPKRNCLVVGFKDALYQSGCTVTRINWINKVPKAPFEALVRLRYRHQEIAATIIPENSTQALVRFSMPQKAVTPGQGAVFYSKDQVLGGGFITAGISQ